MPCPTKKHKKGTCNDCNGCKICQCECDGIPVGVKMNRTRGGSQPTSQRRPCKRQRVEPSPNSTYKEVESSDSSEDAQHSDGNSSS